MAESILSSADRQRHITHHLTALAHLIHAHAPHATVEVLAQPYEDADAHLLVWFPPGGDHKTREMLREVLTARSTDILLDTGLVILAGVYETSQRPTHGATAEVAWY